MKRLLLCLAAAVVLRAPSPAASPDDVSYPVVHKHSDSNGPKQADGTLSLVGSTVIYFEPSQPAHDFRMECDSFVLHSSLRDGSAPGRRLEVHAVSPGTFYFHPAGWMASPAQKIDNVAQRTAPIAMIARELWSRCDVNPESAEREERAAAAFRDSIHTALRAAEEPDPFASIRGDFDLSGSDSRQWKTSLQLHDAEKCGLIRTPPPAPAATPV